MFKGILYFQLMYLETQNIGDLCRKIYKPALVKVLSAPGLAWSTTSKEFDVLSDIDMLLMLEKGIKVEICHSIYQYTKANNKYMKDYDKNKESLYLQYYDLNNLYSQAMSQKLPLNTFKWIEDTSQGCKF